MKIELRKLSEITPYEGNPRQSDAAVDALVASIREFGFRQRFENFTGKKAERQEAAEPIGAVAEENPGLSRG